MFRLTKNDITLNINNVFKIGYAEFEKLRFEIKCSIQ
jgi:hypothetical protein